MSPLFLAVNFLQFPSARYEYRYSRTGFWSVCCGMVYCLSAWQTTKVALNLYAIALISLFFHLDNIKPVDAQRLLDRHDFY